MPIMIHNKSYVTVAERIQAVKKDFPGNYSLRSEILQHDPVLIKATLTIHIEGGDRLFDGHSAANPLKSIEKQTPYEVAESSAWGRALAAAGYGSEESIASADEMQKPTYGSVEVAQMISPPQIRKIAVMLAQTRYGNIDVFQEETGVKVNELSKIDAMKLIGRLEDASMAKVVEDHKEAV